MFLLDETAGGGGGFVNLGEEGFGSEFVGVGGGEENPAGAEKGKDGGDEFAVMFFGLEGAVCFRAREGGRVQDDEVEEARFFREARRPIEEVAKDEIVRGGIEVVEGEVAL